MDSRKRRELQEALDRAILQELGEDASPRLVEHVLRPRNAGTMQDPDGEATRSRACGDAMCIQVRLRIDRLHEIRFMTNGCGPMAACGSVVTELALGRSLREAMRIRPEQVMDALEGLPKKEEHCAVLAVETLRAAVRDAIIQRREPWKRLYRPKSGL
jgi:nitrogen fixation NifU-like protein